MMYPYLTLSDGTEIVHSEMLEDNTVRVYIEKPDEKDGFHYASCFLPKYEWKDLFGFTEDEIAFHQGIIENNAYMIIEMSKNGEVENTSEFTKSPYKLS